MQSLRAHLVLFHWAASRPFVILRTNFLMMFIPKEVAMIESTPQSWHAREVFAPGGAGAAARGAF